MKHIRSKTKTNGPTIINEKQAKIQSQSPESNIPVRTVIYVELYDMTPSQKQALFSQIAESYNNLNGIHYLIPTRDGKITGDAIFENEILDMINQLCEIKDNKIVFKEDAKEVRVIREKI